ncbi:MAG: 30S ribosomal protein S17e [Candidatus Helarchaeota archaeon]
MRTEVIKRLSSDILEKYPDKFTTEFDINKLVLDEIAIVPSKSLRNKIAGYITRLKVIEMENEKPIEYGDEG